MFGFLPQRYQSKKAKSAKKENDTASGKEAREEEKAAWAREVLISSLPRMIKVPKRKERKKRFRRLENIALENRH